ncbi:hypothetical protein Hanom_Chr06g00564651 [Helianthus anomalus]
MISSHRSGGFRGQFIKLASSNTFVYASTDLLRHKHRITVFDAETVTEFLQSSGNLVEMHRLLPSVSFDHIHDCDCLFVCCRE